MAMPGIEARVRGVNQESIKRFKPITVLEVAKKLENNSDKLGLSTPAKIRFNLWTDAISTVNEGFCGKLIIEREQLSKEKISKLTVKIEPLSENDEAAINNFSKRIEDAMQRYENYKHPISGAPDNTDYSLNQISRFKHFYLNGLDGTPSERK